MTLCSLPDVTHSAGKALPSSEKNAAQEGTMAYEMEARISALAGWEDLSSSFYADGGRDTQHERISLWHNRALRAAVACFSAGATQKPRTWRNGEITYRNSRLKGYGACVLLSGLAVGTSGVPETFQLNIGKGDGFYTFQGLDSQGGGFTEAQTAFILLDAVID